MELELVLVVHSSEGSSKGEELIMRLIVEYYVSLRVHIPKSSVDELAKRMILERVAVSQRASEVHASKVAPFTAPAGVLVTVVVPVNAVAPIHVEVVMEMSVECRQVARQPWKVDGWGGDFVDVEVRGRRLVVRVYHSERPRMCAR